VVEDRLTLMGEMNGAVQGPCIVITMSPGCGLTP
jgi:hypothetical protein